MSVAFTLPSDLKVIQGSLPDVMDGGAYVVEMWATWCPPCVRVIPHLSELSKKYTNVTFLGVSNEPAERITPFLQRMGEKMCYNVASGNLSDYSEEYDVSGIPHAFIIKGGKVIYTGHPAAPEFEEKLAEANKTA